MDDVKPLPGPLKFHEQGDADEYCLVTDDKRWVLSFRVNGELMPQVQRATNRRLVLAYNHHDAMLSALRRLLACPALNLDDLDPEDVRAIFDAAKVVTEIGKAA